MKRQWQVRRQGTETLDAQWRWDRAYQYLLRWSSEPPLAPPAGLVASAQPKQEVDDVRRRVCPRIDPAPGPNPDH